MRLLASVLRRFVQKGTLNIIAADGRRHFFEGKSPGPCLTIRLHDRSLHTRLALNPELYAGEAYMNGTLTFEDGSNVGDLMELFSVNRSGLAAHGLQKLLRQVRLGLRRWHQANRMGVAAANARHHYDISTDIYRLFLDDDLNYSCAFFTDPEHETLEDAQRNKLVRATAKLGLRPGMTVAEIGSGWGSFAIHIAKPSP